MNKIYKIYRDCKKSDVNFPYVLASYFILKLKGKNILKNERVFVKGMKNIEIGKLLKVGLDYKGFTNKRDITHLNVRGKLVIEGSSFISRGCRFDIGDNAIVRIGDGTYFNPFTKVIIMHQLNIGRNCAISWDCQLLDDDFHTIEYENKKQVQSAITIGNKVWVGSKVSIYKGTYIADGCVIASNSVVKGNYNERNTLIAGNPAKVVKRNVKW